MLFNELTLIEPILKALSKTGYTEPTPIQEKAIPHVLAGKDLIACAQTGTGKTAAFTIPLLQRMSLDAHSRPAISTLILAPTRELALQIGESIGDYGFYLGLKYQVIFGGVPQAAQVKALRAGTDILVATPGRLLDLIQQRLVRIDRVKYFVLDEADRMLDCGFINDINKVISYLPADKQTLLFSATMPKPIQQLANSLMKDPVKVEVDPVSSTVERINQSVYYVEKKNKTALLVNLLKEKSMDSVLVFTQMKHAADRLSKQLFREGINAQAIHGNKTQGQRQHALKQFRDRKVRVLVATDIAARGIDIDDLAYVVNYDLPDVPETYVHRIGRTGRAGAEGIAISFCDYAEKTLLNDIKKLTAANIEVVTGHPFDVPELNLPPRPVDTSFSKKRNVFGSRRGRTFTQRA